MARAPFWTRLTSIALVVMGTEVLITMVMTGILIPSAVVFGTVPLVLALLVAFGPRWLPALAALWAVMALAGALQYPPFVVRLTTPAMGEWFVLAVAQVVAQIVAAGAGVVATVLALRRARGGLEGVRSAGVRHKSVGG